MSSRVDCRGGRVQVLYPVLKYSTSTCLRGRRERAFGEVLANAAQRSAGRRDVRRRGPLRVAGRGWGEMSDRCDVLFTEPGSLGLRFRPNKQTGAVEIIAINEGTQATRHPELRPGLALTAVGGSSTAGLDYSQVIDLVRSLPGRPLRCSFSGEGHKRAVAPSLDVGSSRQSGGEVASPAEPSSQAAPSAEPPPRSEQTRTDDDDAATAAAVMAAQLAEEAEVARSPPAVRDRAVPKSGPEPEPEPEPEP